jgi:hypothetical protein
MTCSQPGREGATELTVAAEHCTTDLLRAPRVAKALAAPAEGEVRE